MRIFCPAIIPSSSGAELRGLTCRRRPELSSRPPPRALLLENLDDPTRADGAAALADGEAQTLLHRDGLDQLDVHLGVVARHDHLGALGEGHDAGHVRRTEVEL